MNRNLSLLALVLLVLAGCGRQPAAVPIAASFSDPFAYCAAVGTIDVPDARYTGPKVPDAIVQGLRKATGASADAPTQFFQNSYWRCADGKVMACTVGANLPCAGKAKVDRTPSQADKDFCQANPTADVIPAAVTGHDTIYEWKCTNGAPQITSQVTQVDAQGYRTDIWYAIAP